MGRWFGSGGQTNTEYEDLVLFVDATTRCDCTKNTSNSLSLLVPTAPVEADTALPNRSYTLRLKKGALGPNPGSRAV